MAATGCEEQVSAVALSIKGALRDVLFTGLATVMPSAVSALAVMATSVTQTAPALPQALTWSVWLPEVAETVASMELLLTTVVSELSSSEKPIALMGWLEQLDATALSVNWVPTWALLAGL